MGCDPQKIRKALVIIFNKMKIVQFKLIFWKFSPYKLKVTESNVREYNK
jgi:hypothetical protein